MRRPVLLVLVTGCNAAFGVRETVELDGRKAFFDAMPDAPFACPPIGTEPQFSPLVHQVITQRCSYYGFSAPANLAVGQCSAGFRIRTGPIDGPLVDATGLVAPDPSSFLQIPRLAPEGDRVFVRSVNNSLMSTRIMEFARSGDTWTALTDPAFAYTYNDFPSVVGVTPGPHAHLIVIVNYKLRELVSDDAGGWTLVASYTDTELGFVPYVATVTADGLRIVGYGADSGPPNPVGMYWTDRPDVESRFRTGVPLTTLPYDLNDPFLAEDCSRIYFSGFGSIFYIQPQ